MVQISWFHKMHMCKYLLHASMTLKTCSEILCVSQDILCILIELLQVKALEKLDIPNLEFA